MEKLTGRTLEETFRVITLNPKTPDSKTLFPDLEKESSRIKDSNEHKIGWLKSNIIELLPKELREKWNNHGIEMLQIQEAYGNNIRAFFSKGEGNNPLANTFCSTLMAAKNFLIESCAKKQENLVRENGLYNIYQRGEQTNRFIGLGEMFIKINGISIADVLRKPNDVITPLEYYRWSMKALTIEKDHSYDETFLENKDDPIIASYPSMAKEKIQMACQQITALNNLTPDSFESLIRKYPYNEDSYGKIIEKAKMLISHTYALQEQVLVEILFPGSPIFLSLKNAFEEHLKDENPRMGEAALLRLGLNDKIHTLFAFRRATELALLKNENSDFYMKLSNLIKDSVKKDTRDDILITDDTAMFLHNSKCAKDEDLPTFEDLKKNASMIHDKSSRANYLINPQDIDWQNLVVPKTAEFEFIKDKPGQLRLILSYQKEEGKIFDLNIFFNIRKERLDWDFLEDPNDPEMKDMKDAVMIAVKNILLNVQEQTGVSKAQETIGKQKTNGIIPNSLWKDEKTGKATVQRQTIATQETQSNEATSSVENNGIKTILNFPEDTSVKDFIESISKKDRRLISQGIEKIKNGIRRLKTLSVRKYEGKPMYGLQVGDYRIMAVPKNPTGEEKQDKNNRTSEFEIVEIETRSNAFKHGWKKTH